jgi:hypothetical protein
VRARGVAGVIAANELTHSPAWLPLELDAAGVTLVRLDEAAYQAASFLDQRLLGQGYEQGACPMAVIEAAAARLAIRSHYIFHTGHVGSTLVSRLVGAHRDFFSVREPALLRTIAATADPGGAPPLPAALALLSRTWNAGQCAVVKATSFVSELAGPILYADPRAAAIFMFAEPLAYLRGILAGPNSRAETRQLGAARLARLARRAGGSELTTLPRSEGEWIAMSWLCEMTALRETADRFAARVLWIDFDRFLGEPRSGLEAILRALGARPEAREIESLVVGPLMHRYSKAPEHAYDVALRREVLASAELEHASEIRRGMRWLAQAAGRHPLARRTFEMSQGVR